VLVSAHGLCDVPDWNCSEATISKPGILQAGQQAGCKTLHCKQSELHIAGKTAYNTKRTLDNNMQASDYSHDRWAHLEHKAVLSQRTQA